MAMMDKKGNYIENKGTGMEQFQLETTMVFRTCQSVENHKMEWIVKLYLCIVQVLRSNIKSIQYMPQQFIIHTIEFT